MSAANGNSPLLQYQRKPQAQPRAHPQPPQQVVQQPPEHVEFAAPIRGEFYDIVWQTGALGLRFTPGADDEPVVCEITPKACEAIKKSQISVGDVVIAVRVHAIGGPMTAIESLHELVHVFQHEDLPITVRFRSRAHDAPETISVADIARSYTYTWPPRRPLGVSLAMDPCTLHTTITSIDTDRIAPEFLPLEPAPGDILVSVRDLEKKIELDQLRFDQVIDTLKNFPRPCKLTFARLHEDVGSPTSSDSPPAEAPPSPVHVKRSPQFFPSSPAHANYAPAPTPSSPAHAARAEAQLPSSPAHAQRPPMSFPSSPARGRPGPNATAVRRPAPLMKRQSFAVGEMKQVEPLTEEEKKRKAKHEARFYKIVYNGGHIGLVLNDANLELKGKPKKNGYYAFIKKVPKHSDVHGLDQASKGDELIAIGDRDLQHMPFDEVQRELSRISSPTPLVFQRKSQGHAPSIGASLVDGLFLMLI